MSVWTKMYRQIREYMIAKTRIDNRPADKEVALMQRTSTGQNSR